MEGRAEEKGEKEHYNNGAFISFLQPQDLIAKDEGRTDVTLYPYRAARQTTSRLTCDKFSKKKRGQEPSIVIYKVLCEVIGD